MSSSAGRPFKRPRDDSAPSEIRKHESLYYPNGDIVLLSLPKENVITAFRVDTIFLERYSPVFEGMLSLRPPNPDTDVEKYDGVPLVRLHDDAQDLSEFLGALYDPRVVALGRRLTRDTAGLVTGMLKLSTKYEVESLRMRIIDLLSSDWPKDLELWDCNEEEIKGIRKKKIDSYGQKILTWPGPEIDDFLDQLPDPCEIIRLSRDYNIPELLPAAFYHLSRIPPFADPDLPNDSPLYPHHVCHIGNGGRSARFSLLSHTDLMQLAQGTHSISKFFENMSSNPGRYKSMLCNQDKCRGALIDLLKDYELTAVRERDGLRLLRGEDITPPKDICNSCSDNIPQEFQIKRKQFWDQLPRMFGLVETREYY